MRDCTELEGLDYTPIIHKIIEKEIEAAMTKEKDIPEEEGLLLHSTYGKKRMGTGKRRQQNHTNKKRRGHSTDEKHVKAKQIHIYHTWDQQATNTTKD